MNIFVLLCPLSNSIFVNSTPYVHTVIVIECRVSLFHWAVLFPSLNFNRCTKKLFSFFKNVFNVMLLLI